MIVCRICGRTAPEGTPGWLRVSTHMKDEATNRELVDIYDYLCPIHAEEAKGLVGLGREVREDVGQG